MKKITPTEKLLLGLFRNFAETYNSGLDIDDKTILTFIRAHKIKDISEVLEDNVFHDIKPLPNNLKQPKKNYKDGNIGPTSMKRIVEQYTDYKVVLVCSIPENIVI